MKSDNKYGWIQATGYPNEKNIKKHILTFFVANDIILKMNKGCELYDLQ